jgi:F-type H+-transporting ATPase subunit b
MPKKIAAALAVAAPLLLCAQPLFAEDAGAQQQPGLLDLNIGQIVWVLVIFILLVAILYKAAWKNVLAGLTAREQRIRKDIADAEAARLKAEATLREYTKQLTDAEGKVRDILAKAASDAEKVGQSIRMQAQTDSEEIKERANREIEASKNQAIREIYERAADLSTSIAEKILRRNLNADDQRDLVSRSLDQMQEIGGRA